MKTITKLILITAPLLMASNAFADTNGWYIGGEFGAGSSRCSTCDTNEITGEVKSTTGSTPAFDFLGGYQFNRYFALEGGVGMLPLMQVSSTYNKTTGSNPGQRTKTNWAAVGHLYVAVKGMLPITNQFGLFGKAGFDGMGLAYNKPYDPANEDSNNGTSASGVGTYLAVGASYNFSPKWAGNVSYNQINVTSGSTKFDSSYGTLGVTYLF